MLKSWRLGFGVIRGSPENPRSLHLKFHLFPLPWGATSDFRWIIEICQFLNAEFRLTVPVGSNPSRFELISTTTTPRARNVAGPNLWDGWETGFSKRQ